MRTVIDSRQKKTKTIIEGLHYTRIAGTTTLADRGFA